jgi:hypothetical protein
MTLVPVCRAIEEIFQLVVPLAVPLPPRSFVHVISVTAPDAAAVPLNAIAPALVAYVAAAVGPMIVTLGAVVSAGGVYDTANVSLAVWPAASRAVTVMMLVPLCSAIEEMFQLVVPLAVPLPPRSFVHVINVTPPEPAAVPLNAIAPALVANDEAVVGLVIVIVGGLVSGTAVAAVTS